MNTDRGLVLLEFNCRLGDPETQAIMPSLTSDFFEIAQKTSAGTLDKGDVVWEQRPTVSIVLVSDGYPKRESYPPCAISGLGQLPEGVLAYHAGTTLRNGQIYTNGGRVLAITASDDSDIEMARRRAYSGVRSIHYRGKTFRGDIALPEL